MSTVLIVEDMLSLLETLQRGLMEEGYDVITASNGAEGLLLAKRMKVDVVVLDLMLPDVDGLSVIREMRQLGIVVPILIMTARSSLDDRVLGLDSGADDYVVKPVAFEELVARLRSLQRRTGNRNTILWYESLRMDLLARSVTREGQLIDLTRREFELLEYFLRHKNQVVTREMLARDVWKAATATWTNVIEVQIKSLRRKIERPEWQKLLHTIRGEGYQLGEKV